MCFKPTTIIKNREKRYHAAFAGIMVLLLMVLFSHQSMAQKKSDNLKAKRKKIEQEINYTNKLLAETRKNKKNTLYELQLIQQKINQRNELIATLKKEIVFLEKKISNTKSGINNMDKQLASLKEEYAQVVVFLSRNNSNLDKLIFLFSAEDLNQAYQRLRYLDELTAFIRHQADSIKRMETIKQKELTDYNVQKTEKSKLLEKENAQLSKLENNQREKDKVRANLSTKEKQLRAQLRKKRKEAGKLNRQIENIIASETKAKKSSSGKSSYTLTPAEKKLAEEFRNNKGRLPWPTARGFISESYGTHPHPVLKHVMIKNNGINIATGKAGNARAVFKGKVVSVATISNTNKAVIIKHGNWFTVYSNLEQVFVSTGEEVSTKQAIGRIHTNLKGKTELHFEVWNGKQKQNPYYWIVKK
jgi:septal ring factor EnvC (AmiA/AmiB activator)